MATPPKPVDSLDELFDTENRPQSKVHPFNREIGVVRRATPRGVPFRLNVGVKEDEDDDEEKGIPTGIPLRHTIILPYEDRVIINSICTTDTLAHLRKEYQIPYVITLTFPHRGYDVYNPVKCEVPIHVATFECGLRLTLHPTLRRLLVALGLAPL
ncbi:hypothetical protein LWI28_012462 [Acer negundo]|uniref:Uncharacterized protein n=1 Tax=Acer negundo TaxID=4023 RepID=A0AAD5ITU6_ACENE|nr:hypothetical protein LWI28_012462 [Acer negundo]